MNALTEAVREELHRILRSAGATNNAARVAIEEITALLALRPAPVAEPVASGAMAVGASDDRLIHLLSQSCGNADCPRGEPQSAEKLGDSARYRCRRCGEQNVIEFNSARIVTHNRFTGKPRDQRDIDSDPEGKLIVDPGEPLLAASAPPQPGCGCTPFEQQHCRPQADVAVHPACARAAAPQPVAPGFDAAWKDRPWAVGERSDKERAEFWFTRGFDADRAARSNLQVGGDVPEGWVLTLADLSIQANKPDQPVSVMLRRDKAGYDEWLSLDDEAREAFDLYRSGMGMTIGEAIANAFATKP